MWNDPIIQELHQTRADIANECHFNLHEISLLASKVAQTIPDATSSELSTMSTQKASPNSVSNHRR
jgi:hypothetical protein